jgi:hypothetical protein
VYANHVAPGITPHKLELLDALRVP